MTGERLPRELMAARLAAELQDGWIVNLGLGMPTACCDCIPDGRTILFHSENGIIGYGRRLSDDEGSIDTINAGGERVLLQPNAAIVHHADSFALVRSGRLDACILGAYEVSSGRDFSNWKLAGRKGGGIGGAMDIAACAQSCYIIMEHNTRDGSPRLLERCTLPITAPGVVTRVMTDLGLFEPAGSHFRLVEIAPGFTVEQVQALSGAPIEAVPNLIEVTLP